jgi:hypothetical protein
MAGSQTRKGKEMKQAKDARTGERITFIDGKGKSQRGEVLRNDDGSLSVWVNEHGYISTHAVPADRPVTNVRRK